MTVAILADAPTLTTGFGRTTRRMADALAWAGHTVWCFGLKAGPEDGDPADPVRLWPAERAEHHWSVELRSFFSAVSADVLLLNMDAHNAMECVDACRGAGWAGPIVSYVCFDGTPMAPVYLAAQRQCETVWATSCAGAAYLRGEGIEIAGIAPPGVDPDKFRPLPYRSDLRSNLGLTGSFLVGVFATNTARKRLDVAVEGFARAVRARTEEGLSMYLHCRATGAIDLARLATESAVSDRLFFPSAGDHDERRGVADESASRRAPPVTLDQLNYVERINCCDVVLNVPHSGDIEQAIIEAQACGVPVIATDDGGIMAEALGGAGIPLPPNRWEVGPQGQQRAFVDPTSVCEGILRVLDDEAERRRLRELGLANAARFPWRVLEEAATAMVSPFIEDLQDARPSG